MHNNSRFAVVITGASTGIGEATMRRCLARGHRVIATARNEQDLERIKCAGAEAYFLELTSEASVTQCANQIRSATNDRIDVLFNNAGYGLQIAMEDAGYQDLQAQLLANVVGPSVFTSLLLPALGNGSRVIFNSSILGKAVLPFRGPYCASKYAIEAIADSYRLELRNKGVFVHLVEPGPIAANFRKNAFQLLSTILHNRETRLDYARHIDRLRAASPSRHTMSCDNAACAILDIIEGRNAAPRTLITRTAKVTAALKWILGSWFDYVAVRTEPVRERPTASIHPAHRNS